jgi:hypothetical protein
MYTCLILSKKIIYTGKLVKGKLVKGKLVKEVIARENWSKR